MFLQIPEKSTFLYEICFSKWYLCITRWVNITLKQKFCFKYHFETKCLLHWTVFSNINLKKTPPMDLRSFDRAASILHLPTESIPPRLCHQRIPLASAPDKAENHWMNDVCVRRCFHLPIRTGDVTYPRVVSSLRHRPESRPVYGRERWSIILVSVVIMLISIIRSSGNTSGGKPSSVRQTWLKIRRGNPITNYRRPFWLGPSGFY